MAKNMLGQGGDMSFKKMRKLGKPYKAIELNLA